MTDKPNDAIVLTRNERLSLDLRGPKTPFQDRLFAREHIRDVVRVNGRTLSRPSDALARWLDRRGGSRRRWR